MSNRTETALEVLAAGGYFRKALERNYHGGETFMMRLRTATGGVMKGIGFQTFFELEAAGKLDKRYTAPSSTWAEEWVLKGA